MEIETIFINISNFTDNKIKIMVKDSLNFLHNILYYSVVIRGSGHNETQVSQTVTQLKTHISLQQHARFSRKFQL